jgi:hypothetical protein
MQRTISFNKVLIFTLLLAISFLIASLAYAGFGSNHTGSGLYSAAKGSIISLNQDVEVSEGARIHIQNGKVKSLSKVKQLEPYCYFYTNRSKQYLSSPFKVKTAEFTVDDVVRRREFVLSKPLQLASSGFFNNDGSEITLATKFIIHASDQPDLTSLVCGVWADPRERGFVSLNEIQQTLGDIATFTLRR